MVVGQASEQGGALPNKNVRGARSQPAVLSLVAKTAVRDHLLLPPSPTPLIHLSLEWNLLENVPSPPFTYNLLIGCDETKVQTNVHAAKCL